MAADGNGPARVDLYVMNADGSGQRRLARDADWTEWSPDSRTIVFTQSDPGGEWIYVVNADGSGERRLADGTGPVWSPDGQTIAFDRDHAVWIMNADGSGQMRLMPSRGQIYDPGLSWSP